MRAGLDFVSGLAQFFDARPDRRAADGQLLRQLRPRHPAGIRAQGGKNFCVSCHKFLAMDGRGFYRATDAKAAKKNGSDHAK
jgi:hypothetical protein